MNTLWNKDFEEGSRQQVTNGLEREQLKQLDQWEAAWERGTNGNIFNCLSVVSVVLLLLKLKGRGSALYQAHQP